MTLRDLIVFFIGCNVGMLVLALFASRPRRTPQRSDEQPYTSEKGIW